MPTFRSYFQRMRHELGTLFLRLAVRAATSRASLLTQPRCVVVTSALAATLKPLRQSRRRRPQLKTLLPCARVFFLCLQVAHGAMATPLCLTRMCFMHAIWTHATWILANLHHLILVPFLAPSAAAPLARAGGRASSSYPEQFRSSIAASAMEGQLRRHGYGSCTRIRLVPNSNAL